MFHLIKLSISFFYPKHYKLSIADEPEKIYISFRNAEPERLDYL
ncbi:hypothetical protein VINI7043_23417 [Vibrio nigripulchritudo ATCC 27043]|nr:hypothetical protein VINI7043_23417 [Vibrio nigripulchritudo ATCC 27043]